ncbi:hypothetical protein D3C81_1048020 [compost metagenome]
MSPEFTTPEYTRKNVSCPTNGSVMILKASAEKCSSSAGWRSTSLSCSSWPMMGGTSSGDGRYSMTASSIACTPLFLKALPHSMGTISLRMVRARKACFSSASVNVSPFR